jgi:hypothetical protein
MPASSAAFPQQRLQMGYVVVAEHRHRRPGQLRAGPDAGVREFIDRHEVAGPDEARDDAEVGEIA